MAENNPQGDSSHAPASPERGPVSDDARRKSSRRRIMVLGLLAVAAVLGVIFGWPYLQYALSHASTDDAFIDGSIVPISSRVSGQVNSVHVVDNEMVHKGDLLVELDPAPFEARVAAARAALATARDKAASAKINTELTRQTSQADVAQAQAGVSEAKAAVDTAAARIESAQSGLEQAKAQVLAVAAAARRDQLDLKRYAKLHQTGVISPQSYDHAVATAQASQAQLAQARAARRAADDALSEARSRLAEAKAVLTQARAKLARAQSAPKRVQLSASQQPVRQGEIDQAKADLKEARLELQYTKIHAPVSGHVTRKSVEPGQHVAPGQNLMSVVPTAVWVTANYKETDLAGIRPGQRVTVFVDAYPGVSFKARVQSIMAGTGARFSLLPPENATGNYVKVVQRVPVKIVFDRMPDPGKYHLAPGMSVIPEIALTAHPKGGGRTVTAEVTTAATQP